MALWGTTCGRNCVGRCRTRAGEDMDGLKVGTREGTWRLKGDGNAGLVVGWKGVLSRVLGKLVKGGWGTDLGKGLSLER